MAEKRAQLNGAQAELFTEALAAHDAAKRELDAADERIKKLVRAFGHPGARLVGFDTETRELVFEEDAAR